MKDQIPCKTCNNRNGMNNKGLINARAKTYLFQCDRCKEIKVVKLDYLTEDETDE